MGISLRIDGTVFRDPQNRVVTLRGINVAADSKIPANPDLPSHEPSHFFDGDNVSFVGRPFDVADAPTHFSRLRRWGFNTIRYIFTWEAIEAAGPRKYDEDFVKHTISILKVAKQYGFFIIMDPHQDLWSRFSGGCGAPMWTLYACGLNPEKMRVTEAALVQNTWPNPEEFPKMIWATNYTRMACQVLFTIYFGGQHFAPKAVIDGVNIQDYLQNHFVAACKHLARRIKESGEDFSGCLGWESMNEPNRGLIGMQNITVVPSDQKLQLGTSPNAWQAILTGSGRACEVETWSFGSLGPYKSGSALIDPHGETVWLPADHDDSKYGWKRDPRWKLGTCIWAQHDLWEPKSDTLLKKDYFAKDPQTGATIDYEYFTNRYFMNLYRKYRAGIRDVFPQAPMFCQPPVLELPPSIKNTPDDDPNMAYCPHWYDGVTLMSKEWKNWNVDVFGVLRGKYLTPAFAIRLGESAIRNCFRDTLFAMQDEGLKYMGDHPFVLTEYGIPYDLNNSKAYETGDYSTQIQAMDANQFAVEGSKSNSTLWNYTTINNHKWGDHWLGEDLSIYSNDDLILPTSTTSPSGVAFTDRSASFSESHASGKAGIEPSKRTRNEPGSSMESEPLMGDDDLTTEKAGFRAAEAFVRPSPMAAHGEVISYGFELKNCLFNLSISAPTPTTDDAPTEVFLPEFHFPEGFVDIQVSSGKWTIDRDTATPVSIQRLRWWYGKGEHTLRVRGLTMKQRSALAGEEDGASLTRCREKWCSIM